MVKHSPLHNLVVSIGGSVGCASDWGPGGRGFNPRRGQQHSFMEIDHEIFSSHSLPSASRRAVVSFWRKNVHDTGQPLRGLSLPSKSVVR